MEKLPMCRICLAENVLMYVVVNKNMHELYEKLTDIPFVTEDRRPMLACSFCCAILKKCCQLKKKCLEAEVMFARLMNEKYKVAEVSRVSGDPPELLFVDRNGGKVLLRKGYQYSKFRVNKNGTTKWRCVNWRKKCQGALFLNSDGNISRELAHTICEPNIAKNYWSVKMQKVREKIISTQQKVSTVYNEAIAEYEDLGLSLEGPPKLHTHRSKFYKIRKKTAGPNCPVSRDHLESFHGYITTPIEYFSIVDVGHREGVTIKEELSADDERTEYFIEVKAEVQSDDQEVENLDNSCLHVEETQRNHSESDSEAVPLMQIKTDVEQKPEVSEKRPKTRDTENAPDAKQPKLDTQTTKPENLEDAITTQQEKIELSDSNQMIQNTQKPWKDTKPSVDISIYNTAADSSSSTKCKINDVRFTVRNQGVDDDSINRDRRLRIKESPFKCRVCQRSFTNSCSLKRHVRIHIGEKPYKCEVCQSSFNEKSELVKHNRIHTGEKPFKCDTCHSSFLKKQALTKHIRVHTGEKLHKCQFCQRAYSQLANLIKHIRSHDGVKAIKTEICQRMFNNETELIDIGEKPYKCEICLGSFKEKWDLTKHMRTHTGEKPYECEICQRSFSEKGNLNKHIRIHTSEKRYKCEICQHSVNDRYLLTKHMRKHTGEKPYKCDTCQRSFSEKSNLAKHVRIHTGQKLHKCDICEHNFNDKCDLTNHMRMHTGEKPFKC